MAIVYRCASCGLTFRLGSVNLWGWKLWGKWEDILHMVCDQCGTEYIECHHTSILRFQNNEIEYTVLANNGPFIHPMTNEEIMKWRENESNILSLREQAGSISLNRFKLTMYIGCLLGFLTMPLRLLIHLSKLTLYSLVGSWPKEEYENWKEIYKTKNTEEYKLIKCKYCEQTGSLKTEIAMLQYNGIGVPMKASQAECPNCKVLSLCSVDKYDLVLKNGRKISGWLTTGFWR